MRVIVNIDVPQLIPAITFYSNALGLHLARILDDDVAELTGASAVIYLLQKPTGSSPTHTSAIKRHYSRHWTPVHMDFVVEDLDTAAARATAAGAIQESDCVKWMNSKCISFSDPFGHGFCLIEFVDTTYY